MALNEKRLPEDVVEYFLFPLIPDEIKDDGVIPYLEEKHDLYLAHLSTLLVDFIWQNERFSLQPVSGKEGVPPHLHGTTNFGDNIEDEWFIVYLLFRLTKQFPDLVASINDNDEEFMLIEAANSLPKWLNPESAENRVYIDNGNLHIIPIPQSPAEMTSLPLFTPNIEDALKCIRDSSTATIATKKIQDSIQNRIMCFPKKIKENIQHAHCFIPAGLATILEHRPGLIAQGVQAFYYRDPVDLKMWFDCCAGHILQQVVKRKACRTFQYFRPGTRVMSRVRFTRCLYAQLLQQQFTPDKRSGWVLPPPSSPQHKAHELGMKLSHGFEILCAKCTSTRKPQTNGHSSMNPSDVRWRRYLKSLQEKGYFKGEMEGSKCYKQLLDDASKFYGENVHKQNELPMTAGDETLDLLGKLSFDIEEMRKKEQKLAPADDDGWLDMTIEGLEEVLLQTGGSGKQNSKKVGVSGSSKQNGQEAGADIFDLSQVADSMKEFIGNVSDIDGAEFPGEQDGDVQFDSTGFIHSMQKMFEFDDTKSTDSSNMSEYGWNDSDDELGPAPPPKTAPKHKDNRTLDDFMHMMDKELSKTEVGKSFEKEPMTKKPESKSRKQYDKDIDEEDDGFRPVSIDVNIVKNMLDSYSAQQGLPGPASNILNSMGVKLPQNKDDYEGP